MKSKMFSAAAFAVGLCLVSAAPASAITLTPGDAILTGGASLIGNDTKIKFDGNTAGQTATWTFPSIPGQAYIISVTGQNNQSESFFRFFIDADGPGSGGYVQLGADHNFGNGFHTFVLPSYIDVGTTDYFQIVNGTTGAPNGQGNASSEGQIELASVTIRAVPGPVVGAGLPGLIMAIGGLLAWRRRRVAA